MSTWQLQTAKARLSELVRRARTEGPQTISVHGKDEVVLISADLFRSLTEKPVADAKTLFDALQPVWGLGLDLERKREAAGLRDVDLAAFEHDTDKGAT